MDLATMEQKLKDAKYMLASELIADIDRLYTNSAIFNGPDHILISSAAVVRDSIKTKPAAVFTNPDLGIQTPDSTRLNLSQSAAIELALLAEKYHLFKLADFAMDLVCRNRTRVPGFDDDIFAEDKKIVDPNSKLRLYLSRAAAFRITSPETTPLPNLRTLTMEHKELGKLVFQILGPGGNGAPLPNSDPACFYHRHAPNEPRSSIRVTPKRALDTTHVNEGPPAKRLS